MKIKLCFVLLTLAQGIICADRTGAKKPSFPIYCNQKTTTATQITFVVSKIEELKATVTIQEQNVLCESPFNRIEKQTWLITPAEAEGIKTLKNDQLFQLLARIYDTPSKKISCKILVDEASTCW